MNRSERRRREKIAKKAAKGRQGTAGTFVAAAPPAQVDQALSAAIAHHGSGRVADAEKIYNRILETIPDHPDALHLAGVAAGQQGRRDEAIQRIEQALVINPDLVEAHNNLGNILKDAGRLDDAETHYREALARKSDYADAHGNLAILLHERGNLAAATDAYRKALEINSENDNLLCRLGDACFAQGQPEEAVDCYRKALAVAPRRADVLNNLGNAYKMLKRYDEAADSYRQAVAIEPDFAVAHSNLGATYGGCDRFDEALSCHDKAVSLAPDNIAILLNWGVTLKDAGRLDDAEAAFRQAMIQDPECAETHAYWGQLQLLQGDFQRGWANYAWRHRMAVSPIKNKRLAQPLWDGGDIKGKTLYVFSEQGVGDTVQFVRFLPRIARTGCRVLLEAPESLTTLLQDVEGVDVVPIGAPLPDFDCYVPLMDVPMRLNLLSENDLASPPYLRAPAGRLDAWANRIADDGALRVGLVWAGNPSHQNDQRRSMAADLFRPLCGLTGVRLYSLQVGRDGEAAAVLGAEAITDLAPDLRDYSDTAAALARLDLVVTVDTSVAHLAGAIGTRAWVLLAAAPDWRWMLERDDSPWYSDLRLIRQSDPGDWAGVIARVVEGLQAEAHGKTG